MPFPFALPTTSSFSFSSSFSSESHPSLPLSASTHRGVVRDALKKFKRLPPSSQGPNLPALLSNINTYLPYVFAIDAGLGRASQQGEEINVILTSTPAMEWRPTLSENPVPGRESPRTKVQSLEYDLSFTLSTLGYAYSLLARSSLRPLHVTSEAPLSAQARTAAITTATKHLLDAASVHDYLARRAEAVPTAPPCIDISQPTARAMASLALAEATLLAVLKDDPYPAVVSQDRNDNDREWMYKAPEIPKVRAHLFARLCLAAADHAAQASSLCQPKKGGGGGGWKINDDLLRYLEDLRKTSRAKACRFFGIDAELSGQTGNAIGWLRCGLQELGIEPRGETKKGLSLSRMKKDWSERREDKKIERGTNWGSDAGRLEETRVIEMLEAKWTKVNDTILTQAIPAGSALLASLPSGRDIHSIKPYQPPELSRQSLESMRALPDQADDYEGGQPSSDDEERTVVETPVGAYPGTPDNHHRSGSTRSYY
ncbi:pH-response regulator protein palC [Xylaria curta]|nr:pH-response regulator protein palC [Xylaria curta]